MALVLCMPATTALVTRDSLRGPAPDSPRMQPRALRILKRHQCRVKKAGKKQLISRASSGKKNKIVNVLVVVQLIHSLAQADISYTTKARFILFPLLYHEEIQNLQRTNAFRGCMKNPEILPSWHFSFYFSLLGSFSDLNPNLLAS